MANTNGWGDGASNNTIGWGQGANNTIGWGDIHADSWAGATDIIGFQAASLLLDTYTGAAVAYSLRKLRTDYTGAAIRVRRTDLAEQDIAFDSNGDLDTTALLSFVGTGVLNNGFITTWYDQSGNANDATQATALSQAQIVASGAVITDPNTGKISVTWTNDNYTISNVAITQNMLMSAVVNRTLTNNALAPLGTTSANPYLFSWSSTGNIVSRIGATATTHESTNTTVGAYIVSALRDGANVVKAFRNTTALTTGTNTGTGINFIRFGTAAGFNTTGRMVEMIHWNNDKESSRADIVTNQNTYWNAY
jgi:hypothetical protein